MPGQPDRGCHDCTVSGKEQVFLQRPETFKKLAWNFRFLEMHLQLSHLQTGLHHNISPLLTQKDREGAGPAGRRLGPRRFSQGALCGVAEPSNDA